MRLVVFPDFLMPIGPSLVHFLIVVNCVVLVFATRKIGLAGDNKVRRDMAIAETVETMAKSIFSR